MNIYVGSLSYHITEKDLQKAFEAFRHVESSKVIMDTYTGRSKGFGFVEMSTGEEAQTAMDALNSTEVGGRTLTVNEAKPQAARPGGGGRGGFGGDPGGSRGGGGRRRF